MAFKDTINAKILPDSSMRPVKVDNHTLVGVTMLGKSRAEEFHLGGGGIQYELLVLLDEQGPMKAREISKELDLEFEKTLALLKNSVRDGYLRPVTS